MADLPEFIEMYMVVLNLRKKLNLRKRKRILMQALAAIITESK